MMKASDFKKESSGSDKSDEIGSSSGTDRADVQWIRFMKVKKNGF